MHPAAVSLSPTLSFLRKPHALDRADWLPCRHVDHLQLCAPGLHTFRTRDVSGISLGMYSVFTTGVALWLVYGIAAQAWPIVVANAITLLLASTILGMKLRFAARPAAERPVAYAS